MALPSWTSGLALVMGMALIQGTPGPSPGAIVSHPAPADTIDPVGRLIQDLEAGNKALAYDPAWGYLPALLEELDIPVSSQSLVFSRTSLQVDMIAPWAPRALYFNDDVYIGFTVDGLILEIASVDPDGGTVFYTLDQLDPDQVQIRQDDLTCKGCHQTGITGGVSGVMMRSFLTDRMGNTVAPVEERPVDDRTPMDRKFGGWYVTGGHSLPHAGNIRAPELTHEIDDPSGYLEGFDMTSEGNLESFEGRFDESFYISEGSDIVALSVLAHQTRLHNLITIAAEAAAEALEEQAFERLITGEGSATSELSGAMEDRVDFAVRALVRGMLFYRAAPLGQLEGTSTFASDFAARGPRDGQGRSLRDFSLDGRLFEYPLSFLIYSDAWDALPDLVRTRAYAQMVEILEGEDDPEFPLLDETRRQAILEILQDTKPDFALYLSQEEEGSAAPPDHLR